MTEHLLLVQAKSKLTERLSRDIAAATSLEEMHTRLLHLSSSAAASLVFGAYYDDPAKGVELAEQLTEKSAASLVDNITNAMTSAASYRAAQRKEESPQ